ncbi:MAG: phosphate ABC transporter permease PstA, partial [Verrucomicrobiaceae bacterium]
MAKDRPILTYSVKPPKGEAQVWLTAMGLAIGIVMVVGLLGLILKRGTDVFWPKRVVEIQLKEGGPLLGEIVLRQKNLKTGREEWLVHSGNKSKDDPGSAYRYVDTGEVTGTTEPAGVMKAKRMEYGDALFYPVNLTARDGASLRVSDAGFNEKLKALMKTGESERRQVEKLEKVEIGRINQKIQNLDNKVKVNPASAESLAAEKASLQAEYEKLAAQARGLHEALGKDILRCRLVGGEERDQAIGELIRIYEPNKLGFWARLKTAISQFWDFLSEDPREANTEGGIFPAIFGTFVMTILMSAVVTPLGVIAAIYLREYARQGLLVQVVRISVNNLAGVPSIVFGVFGLGFFVYTIGSHVDEWFFSDALPTPTFGTGGILWASLTLALLTLPVVIVATEEALAAVPRGVREAALACGASKWQTIQRVVLPASAPGVLTGVILAMARGAGEVAPLMLVGVVKLAPSLPLDTQAPFIHAERKFMHLGFHIFDVGFQSPDSLAAQPMVYATTLLLITLVVVMNLAAILLRNKLR